MKFFMDSSKFVQGRQLAANASGCGSRRSKKGAWHKCRSLFCFALCLALRSAATSCTEMVTLRLRLRYSVLAVRLVLTNPSFSAKLDLNKSSRLLRSFAWRSKRDAPRRRVPFPAFLRSPHLFFTPIFRGVRGARLRSSTICCLPVPYRRSL